MGSPNILELKRKAYKEHLFQIIKDNPELPLSQIIGILSTRTGLSHTKIKIYLEELIAEGRVPIEIKFKDKENGGV